MIKKDLHIHSSYCDGNDTVEEIIKHAISLKMETVGILAHSYTQFDEEPCIKEEDIPVLYGSTLLEAVYFEMFNFWFALQIGDGKCAVIKADDSVVFPSELENEKLGFGVTTSLCSKNAPSEFRYAFGFEKINGISVMSDGLTDSFDAAKLPDFILNLKTNMMEDSKNTVSELKDFLPVLSEQGSGDDISISAIFSKKVFI